MNRASRRMSIFRWALVLLCLPAAGRLLPQEGIPGLRYENRRTDLPLSAHILEVDPAKIRIQAVRALNNGIGRETVSSIAARKGAVAAVNAGFFRIGGRFDGEPDGILKIGGVWFSEPRLPRGAVGWTESGSTRAIGRLEMYWCLLIDGAKFPVQGINRPRAPEEAVLFGWAFHRSTLTDPGGHEVAIAGGRVAGVAAAGDSPIPVNGYVYSVGPGSALSMAGIERRDPVKVLHSVQEIGWNRSTEKRDWEKMDYIVGGVPVLVQAGIVVQDFDPEKAREGFITDRHPRTAVGFLPDGKWIVALIDGRQPRLSVGMTVAEIAAFMHSLGCTSALNLDGGGSSTMVLQGRVVNSPSDGGQERPVSDAIVFLPR
ncbi:MAG: phosphodiester glycosidase family protein [Acidobacteriota bacterium]